MGCPKITSYQEGEGLEKSTVHFFGQLAQKRGQQKICINYYPFGGTFNSWVDGTKNNYLYNQGTGDKTFKTERQPELEVDMTKFRVYDYWTGRFWQIDPKADQEGQESWNPYHYSFNNPIRWNDPFGDNPPGNPLGPNPLGAISEGFRQYFDAAFHYLALMEKLIQRQQGPQQM